MSPSLCQLAFTETSSPAAPSTGTRSGHPPQQHRRGLSASPLPVSQLLSPLFSFTFGGNSIAWY